MNAPRRCKEGTGLAAAPAPAPKPAPQPNDGPSGVAASEVTLIKLEEKETLGQLRDRLAPGLARVPALGPRAPFVHIKVEDTSSGEETDREGGGESGEDVTGGEGDGEEEAEEVEEEVPEEEEEEEVDAGEEEPTDLRNLRAHESGASLLGGSEMVRLQILPPEAHSEPESPRAPLPASGRVADDAVQDNDVQQQQHMEAGIAPVLVMGSGGDRAGTSQFQGVCWLKKRSKWQAACKKKHLGYHTTEEAAARAYGKYLEDGSVSGPAERGVWCTS